MNDIFEESFSRDEDSKVFKGKMFWIWEDNHRVTAWRRHINTFHAHEEEWHYRLDCICLNALETTGVLLDVMNDVNMYDYKLIDFKFLESNGFNFIFMNLFYWMTYHRRIITLRPIWFIKFIAFVTLKLQKFKFFLSPDNYAKCEKKRSLFTWYPLTADIFAAFIYKVSL